MSDEGSNGNSLRSAFMSTMVVALLALAGLWVASWKPHTWADRLLTGLAWLVLCICGCWLVLAGITFVWSTTIRR